MLPRLGKILDRPSVLVASAVIVAVAAFHFWITPANPPGFFRDEAAISLNATTLSRNLTDEDGARLPLYFTSFGDYKSPIFIYSLAAVFRLTGPHAEVARGLAAVGMLTAILLLGLLAYRRTGDRAVGVVTVLIAGTTPWLFEVGRLAFEVSFLPLVLCLLLLALDRAIPGFGTRSAISVGVALGLLVYVYAAGRLLAPLFALALLVFVSRERLRWLATAWVAFGIALIPLAVFWLRHHGALSARFNDTRFDTAGMSRFEIARTAASNALHDLNLWHWLTAGDTKPYQHAWGAPSLLFPLGLLALAGIGWVAWRQRGTCSTATSALSAVLSTIPAALTKDRFHALRLLPLPVLLVVLAIPAIDLVVAAVRRRSRAGQLIAVALVLIGGIHFAHFIDDYKRVGPTRTERFEAGVPSLLARALAKGGPVYIDFDDRQPQAHARWYAASRGLPESSVVVLPDGGVPPPDSWIFGYFKTCDYACAEVGRSGDYWIARGPPEGELTPGRRIGVA